MTIDLKGKLNAGQLNSLNALKSVLREQIAQILPVYRRAPEAKKSELKAHNPALKAILEIIGE